MYLEESLTCSIKQIIPILQNRFVWHTTYFGIRTLRNPLDTWVYQEIIFENKPDVIIEIGTYRGGLTLWLAHLCDSLGKGRVISINVDHNNVSHFVKEHNRVELVLGDANKKISDVSKLVNNTDHVLVIEDSSHTYNNTLSVLRTYSELLKTGDWFIVEDTNCHHGLNEGPSPGPYEAVEKFLSERDDFESDRSKESFVITWNPTGFLRKVK